jgi:hypothetical protein
MRVASVRAARKNSCQVRSVLAHPSGIGVFKREKDIKRETPQVRTTGDFPRVDANPLNQRPLPIADNASILECHKLRVTPHHEHFLIFCQGFSCGLVLSSGDAPRVPAALTDCWIIRVIAFPRLGLLLPGCLPRSATLCTT